MLDLKELEKKRKEYQEVLDNMKKIEGEEKGVLAEKDRIDKMIAEAGFKSIDEVKKELGEIESKLTALQETITEKCKV